MKAIFYSPLHRTFLSQSNDNFLSFLAALNLVFFLNKDHYDFGMRSIKSVLVMAGQKKRETIASQNTLSEQVA